jgi:sialidase-1
MRVDLPSLSPGILLGIALSVAVLFPTAASGANEPVQQVDVFQGGTEGYHTYRIPAIVLSSKNTLLAFCEGRKTGAGDAGEIDLMLRRSTDSGKTWQRMQVVYEEGSNAKITIGNPCPVVERSTGTIWLPFCRNNDLVFITKSTDDGLTWDKPMEITKYVKKPECRWYATGPGHGIQLQSGRLVIPCDCNDIRDKKQHSLVFYSDDLGRTWKLGGVTESAMDECEVVELIDKSLLLSMRNYQGKNRRAFATSNDAGLTWTSPTTHGHVYCPTCQASIQRYSPVSPDGNTRILYSGPGGPGRKNMTVRLSYDEGKTWRVAKVLHAGSAAYSDLVILPDGSIGCLYERDGYRKISFARFTLDWLTDGNDYLYPSDCP